MTYPPGNTPDHTKMVKHVLRTMASESQVSYQVTFRRFIGEEPLCIDLFWTTFFRLYPDSPYRYTAYSYFTQSFELYEDEPFMPGEHGGF